MWRDDIPMCSMAIQLEEESREELVEASPVPGDRLISGTRGSRADQFSKDLKLYGNSQATAETSIRLVRAAFLSSA
jgi:hypothetical protein